MRNPSLSRWSWLSATILGLGVLCLLVLGQGPRSDAAEGAAMMSAGVTKAVCVVYPLGDNKVAGKVTFTKTADGVEVSAELTGLTPGEHGFHIHEFGDCSMADGVCAGAHFNPTGKPHGGPDSPEHHAGDFGNLTADSAGKATLKLVDKSLMLNGPDSIVGRAIIVHADPDDLTTQPSGNAGARIGCGVIGIADPKMEM